MNWWLFAGLVTVLLFLLAWLLHTRWHVFQYLFFGRFPLACGLALLLLPFLSLKEELRNVFVLDAVGLFTVSWIVTFAAWTVMFNIALVYLTAGKRCDLPFSHTGEPNRIPGHLVKYGPLYFMILALPTYVVTLTFSEATWWKTGIALVAGVGVAWALREGARRWWLKQKVVQPPDSPVEHFKGASLDRIAQKVGRFALERTPLKKWKASVQQGYDDSKEPTFRNDRAYVFLVLTIGIYLISWWVLKPDYSNFISESVPALFYILMLLILICWLLSQVSILLDRPRFPVTLVVVLVSWLSFTLLDTDANYPLAQRPTGTTDLLPTPEDALKSWAGRHPKEEYPCIVVVATSGGGITAAYWTAVVLTQLEADDRFGKQFRDSIVLISSVSGGGVGAMYYVQDYQDPHSDVHASRSPQQDLRQPLVAAGTSSLAATAWGIVCPDIWRAIPRFGWSSYDRGWALEQRWAQQLVGRPTLRSWAQGVSAGWRPAQVFNATITETGERFLMSPLKMPTKCPRLLGGWPSKDFSQLYPGADLEVATAARLSATFPYVSPIARPPRGVSPGYHIADGGYYDNFGILTALDYINSVQTLYVDELKRRKVILLEIRASSPGSKGPKDRSGWLFEFIGPAITLMNVRTPSQIERNDSIRDSIADNERSILLYPVIFSLEEPMPLSWHLSNDEKRRIEEAWRSDGVADELRKLHEFFSGT